SRRRHTRFSRDWSSDVCSSDLRCAESLCLDELLVRNLARAKRDISYDYGCDADDDERDLRRLAQPQHDEQDRQDRERGNHAESRDERQEQRADVRHGADRKADAQTERAADTQRDEQPLETRAGVRPPETLAAAAVFLEGISFDRIDEA